jgi:hypothetical protein
VSGLSALQATALLFIASFAVVFTLGLQQLNVEARHPVAAFITSILIGASSLVLYKLLPGPTDALQIAAYLVGGACGIVASMWAHPVLVRLFRWPADYAEAQRALREAHADAIESAAKASRHASIDTVGRSPL